MEEVTTVEKKRSSCSEDEGGYVQCNVESVSVAVASCVHICIPFPSNGDHVEGGTMSSRTTRKRSKSVDRLTGLSVRPSSNLDTSNSLATSVSSLNLAARRELVARPPPRIPPRPNAHVLTRFEQKKAVLTSPGPTRSSPKTGKVARQKYVELDVADTGQLRGRPQQPTTQPRSKAGRTSYAVLQIDDATSGPNTGAASSRRPRQGRSAAARVQRCKSSLPEHHNGTTTASRTRTHDPRHSTALITPASNAHVPHSTHLHAPTTVALSPRKPRKSSTPVLVSPTQPHPLPPRAVTQLSNHCHSNVANYHTDKVSNQGKPKDDSYKTSNEPALHIIDLRSGISEYRNNDSNKTHSIPPQPINSTEAIYLNIPTTGSNGTLSHDSVSHTGGTATSQSSVVYSNTAHLTSELFKSGEDENISANARHPPPPSRIPPIRPSGPTPRPRKPRSSVTTNTPVATTPPETYSYVKMSPSNPRKLNIGTATTDSAAPSLTTSSNQLCNGNAINNTPLPRLTQTRKGEGGEGVGSTVDAVASTSEECYEAYSYVDVVKNRHLMVHDQLSNDSEGTSHPTVNQNGK